MKLAILGGGGVRMPGFVRAVLASRPGAFDEICLFEPDRVRRETTGRLAAELAVVLGHPEVVRISPDAAEVRLMGCSGSIRTTFGVRLESARK